VQLKGVQAGRCCEAADIAKLDPKGPGMLRNVSAERGNSPTTSLEITVTLSSGCATFFTAIAKVMSAPPHVPTQDLRLSTTTSTH
jgi:hypothetical protein